MTHYVPFSQSSYISQSFEVNYLENKVSYGDKIPSYTFNLYFHIALSLFRSYRDCTETHCIAERAESGNWNCRTDNRILFVSKHFLRKLERLSGETRNANGVSMIVRNRTYY